MSKLEYKHQCRYCAYCVFTIKDNDWSYNAKGKGGD